MTDQQSQALLTFFQFAFLNQVQAEEAAQQAYQRIDHLARTRASESFEVLFVEVTHHIFGQVRKLVSKGSKGKQGSIQSALAANTSGTDLSPWRDYFKSAAPEELTVVIWALILKLPLTAISSALDLSPGTLQHRLSRGVRKLSIKLESAPSPQVRRPWS